VFNVKNFYIYKKITMKQILFFFIALVSLASCDHVSGSGNIITEKRQVGNFKGISAGGGFEVEVRIGSATEVTVEADDNVIEFIETTVSGGVLKIRTEDRHNFSNAHMKVYVTVPSLNSIRASASASITVDGLLTGMEKISFQSSSSGSINAEVDAPVIETDVSSAGSVNISGKTKTHIAEASSGGSIKASNLLSEQTNVSASSGASADVHASISLKANGSSGANISYRGAAAVNKALSSGASAEKRD
jgi:Putative auto-transporter adhesin, head GIN domain